jgi:hypothetical protein
MPVLLAVALAAAPHDVTTSEARRQNLLEYVASRDDLSDGARSAWDAALRRTFGGTALKDGADEGITAAKSVIAGAIFFGIEPARGATAAYNCYHDTFRW